VVDAVDMGDKAMYSQTSIVGEKQGYSMTRLVHGGLAALVVCLSAVAAIAADPAASATDGKTADRQAIEKTMADLSLRVEDGRKTLVETRRAMEGFAGSFETENERARELVAEMDQLRRTLREKDAELRRMLTESPEYTNLVARENELAEQVLTAQQDYMEQAKRMRQLQDPKAVPAPEASAP
jgi:hypothetical protein